MNVIKEAAIVKVVYRDFFSGSSQKCQMKASVLELVRVIGTPNVELQQFIIED